MSIEYVKKADTTGTTIYLPELFLSPHYWLYEGYDSQKNCDTLTLNPFSSIREAVSKVPELHDYIRTHDIEWNAFVSKVITDKGYSVNESFRFENGVEIMIDTIMLYSNIDAYKTAGYLSGKAAKFYINLYNLYRELNDYYTETINERALTYHDIIAIIKAHPAIGEHLVLQHNPDDYKVSLNYKEDINKWRFDIVATNKTCSDCLFTLNDLFSENKTLDMIERILNTMTDASAIKMIGRSVSVFIEDFIYGRTSIRVFNKNCSDILAMLASSRAD